MEKNDKDSKGVAFYREKNENHKCLAFTWKKMTNTRSVWLLYEKNDKHNKSSPNDILFIMSKILIGFLNL